MTIAAVAQSRVVAAGGTVAAGRASPLPAWVPAAGDSATLTNANGLLTNHLRDVVPDAGLGYLDAYGIKIRNDYSGAVALPVFGTHGAIAWHSGGHSATNNNGVYALQFDASGATFRRLLAPSDVDTLSSGAASAGLGVDRHDCTSITDAAWGELADGRPLAPHAWQCQVYLPPESGGGTLGSLVQVVNPAAGHAGTNHKAAHEFAFNSTTAGDVTVSRASAAGGALSSSVYGAPVLCARIGNRALITANATGDMEWLNLDTGAYVTGTNARVDVDGADSSGGGADTSSVLMEIHARDLIVCAQRRAGVLRITYVDMSAADPVESSPVTLSASVSIPDAAWSAACYCTDTGKIIVGGLASDGIAEIAVPATLTDTWTVTTVTPPSGGVVTGETGLAFSNARGNFAYLPELKCVVILPTAAASGDDTVHVYRPQGT